MLGSFFYLLQRGRTFIENLQAHSVASPASFFVAVFDLSKILALVQCIGFTMTYGDMDMCVRSLSFAHVTHIRAYFLESSINSIKVII